MRSWVERGSMPYSAVTQPLPEPLQEGRGLFLQAGGDQHMGIAEFDQAGAFGMRGDARFQADGAQAGRARGWRGAWGCIS